MDNDDDVEMDFQYERTALQEDEKKLQIALKEYDDEWDYASDDEDVNNEEEFLIDLDHDGSSDQVAGVVRSAGSAVSSAASVSQSGSLEDEENQGTEENAGVSENPPATSFNDLDLGSATAGVADPEKALALNRAMQGILEGHIESIQDAIVTNNYRQRQLEEDQKHPIKVRQSRATSFRAPYFRVGVHYPEPNDDVKAKRQLGQATAGPQGIIRDIHMFQPRSKVMLRKSVLEDCLQQKLKPVMTRLDAELQRRDKTQSCIEELEADIESTKGRLKCCKEAQARMMFKAKLAELEHSLRESRTKLKQHKKTISELEKEMENIKNNVDEDELLNNVDTEKVDWMRISKMNFGGQISWVDCLKTWEHFVNPKITRTPWLPAEKARLKEILKGWGPEPVHPDWVQVAQDLGTGRTAFQCMSAYQRSINPAMGITEWTKEEDQILLSEANKVKESLGFINWKRVSAKIDGRSFNECLNRFNRIDPNHRHGPFTAEEDAKILAGYEMFGTNWLKVARFVGKRNYHQVRERYCQSLNPENNYMRFTYEEDVALLKARKRLGPVWARIARLLPGRSAPRVQSRYRQLLRWKKKKAWFERQPASVRRILLGESLPAKSRQLRKAQVHEYLTQQLGINMDDYQRQERDRINGVDPDIIPPRPPYIMRAVNEQMLVPSHANRWAEKLNTHWRLRENLKRLLKQNALRRQELGQARKLSVIEEEREEERIMNQAVVDTLEDQKDFVPPSKASMKKLEAMMSEHFLKGNSMHVWQILDSFKGGSMQEQKKKLERRSRAVDEEIKRLIRRKRKSRSRIGRLRMLFAKDMRPPEVHAAEEKELKHSVPGVLLKALGSSLPEMYLRTRRHHISLQNSIHNFPEPKDDPEYMALEAKMQQMMEDTKSQETVRSCRRRIKQLEKLMSGKYEVEKKRLGDSILDCQHDLTHLDNLLSLQGTKVRSELAPVWTCSSTTPSPAKDTTTLRRGRSQRGIRPISPSEALPTENKRKELIELEEGGVLKLKWIEENKQKGKKLSQKEKVREDGGKISQPASARFHELTMKEVEEEQRRINRLVAEDFWSEHVPDEGSSDLGTLPCLPPSLTSLTLLKDLLLRRGQLMRLAAPISKLPELTDIPAQKEELLIVDTHGREVKGEDWTSFIVEEKQGEGGGEPKQPVGHTQGTEPGDSSRSPLITQPPAMKHLNRAANRAAFKDQMSSRPEFNVANFSLGGSTLQREGKKGEKIPVKEGKVKSKPTYNVVKRGGEKVEKISVKEAKVKSKSTYNVVYGPTSKSASPLEPVRIKKEDDDDLLKPFQPVTKTYAGHTARKRSLEHTASSAEASKSPRITENICVEVGKLGKSPRPSTSGSSISSGKSYGTSSSKSGSATVSSSQERFEFPTLYNTGNEYIEIVEGDSSDNEEVMQPDRGETERKATVAKYDRMAGEEGKKGVPEVVIVDIFPNPGSTVHLQKDKAKGQFGASEARQSEMNSTERLTQPSQPSAHPSQALTELRSAEVKLFPTPATSTTTSSTKPPYGSDSFINSLKDGTQKLACSGPCDTLGSWESMVKEDQLLRRRATMVGIRQSQAYQRLRARMRALFLWPVFMSTVRHMESPSLEKMFLEIGEYDLTVPFVGDIPPINQGLQMRKRKQQDRRKFNGRRKMNGKKRGRPSISELAAREAARIAAREAAEIQGSAGTGNGTDDQAVSRVRMSKRHGRHQPRPLPPRSERPRRKCKVPEKLNTGLSPSKRDGLEAEEEAEPVRKPLWWREAMLAAMEARQAMKSPEEEVPIEEDEDFQDKGNYSDDEWVQDWRRMEAGAKEGSGDGQEEHAMNDKGGGGSSSG